MGLRVNATPVPDVGPMLPNTIICTFTAVPRSSGIRSIRRYVTARCVFHDRNTASIASRSCATGSDGNSCPVASLYMSRNRRASRRRSAGLSSGSVLTPARFLAALSADSNLRPSMSFTVLPNIWMKRRRASSANRSSPASSARPRVVSSLRPRLRTVSIMPGIENLAPERTLTSSGLRGSPNFLSDCASIFFSAVVACSHMPGGKWPLAA